jgi:2-oxoglutarate ferredoxin oxidoreductase subunit delta
MPEIRVLEKYCKGCGLCVPACPKKILYLSEEVDRRGVHVVKARADIPCTGCLNCTTMCPDAALEVDE